jgi:hypothetical protein
VIVDELCQDLDVILNNRKGLGSCSLSLECSNVWSKYLLGQINIFEGDWKILDGVHGNDNLEILDRRSAQCMVDLPC